MRFYRCGGLNLTQIAAGHYKVRDYEIRRVRRMWETFDSDGYHVSRDFTLAEACAYIVRLCI